MKDYHFAARIPFWNTATDSHIHFRRTYFGRAQAQNLRGEPFVSTIGIRPNPADRRRSQRILLPIAVRISGESPDGQRIEEHTSTLVVNAHGALLQLREPVRTGQMLSIKNMATGEETNCTVRDISAVPGGLMEIGLESTEARSRFWRAAFPPPDWSPRSP